jgi:hypothetical protein
VLAPYQRTGRADRDKAALLALAAELRRQLGPRYARRVASSHPEILTYLRRFQTADYVFVVNDRREYGQYVGHHGLVMENGLPAQGTLSLERPDGTVYDLVRHCSVPARRQGNHLLVDLDLAPCDGGLLLVSSRRIEAMRIQAPEVVERGNPVNLTVEVVDAEGRAVDAVVPLELIIRDADGRPAEFSGFHAAVGGRLQIALRIAANDPPGAWRIEVRDLASGLRACRDLRVRPPATWPPAPKAASNEAADPVQPQG